MAEDKKKGDLEQSYKIFSREKKSTDYDVYLGETFDSPTEYTDLLHKLSRASKEDTFTFYLNSYGGRLDAGIQLGAKLRTTKAHTKTIIEAPCYSMGAIFPFMTSEVEMLPHAFLMFHMYSTGSGRQKGNELELSLAASTRLFHGLLVDYCSKLLTKEEIKDIVDGKDLYLDTNEVSRRMKKSK